MLVADNIIQADNNDYRNEIVKSYVNFHWEVIVFSKPGPSSANLHKYTWIQL